MSNNLLHKQKINSVRNVFSQVKSLWIRCGLVINSVVQPFIMGLLFFFIFIPIGIIFKYKKRDLLRLHFYCSDKSYWVRKQKFNPENMKYQF